MKYAYSTKVLNEKSHVLQNEIQDMFVKHYAPGGN